ncbi:unnamed protein product [Prunus brigantina]
MAFYNTIKHLVSLIALFYVAGAVLKNLTAQSCGCAPEICCSQYGNCGSGDGYWGQGYKEGPCTSSGGSKTTTPRTNGNGGSSVADIVTPEFFNRIINQVFRPSFYVSKIKANWSKYMIWALIVQTKATSFCQKDCYNGRHFELGSSEIVAKPGNGTEEDKEGTLALANATEKALQLHDNLNSTVKGTAKSIAVFLATRSYQGLDIHYEGSLPEPYFIGRSRRAARYEDEKNGHEKS